MKLIRRVLKDLSDFESNTGMTLGEFVYHPYKMVYGDLKKVYRTDSLSHAFARAEKKGLVKRVVDKDQVYIALTDLGEEELGASKRPEDWDGVYRFVIFDIPEKDRVVRDLLRKKLKRFGFIGWQKSVWLARGNVTKKLRKFLAENKLEDFVLVIETKDLGNEKLVSRLSSLS